MNNKMFLLLACCAAIAFFPIYDACAVSDTKHPFNSKMSSIELKYSNAGYVSLERIVKFEDIEQLSPAMRRATALLRTGRCQEALEAFQFIERATPAEALAYRGENESSRFLGTLDSTIVHDKQLLAAAKLRAVPIKRAYLAAMNYALGDAMCMVNYSTPIGSNPRDLGPEPKQYLLEAIRIKPSLLEPHLALAAYYEHGSQRQGTAARREYDVSLWLRPDIYQIRYLHAASWDRPGFPLNEAELQAHGIKLSNDEKSIPQRATTENLSLVRDHPSYSPPYYSLGSDYADPRYPSHDDVKARYYLALYVKIGDPTSAWWQYAVAEVKTIDRQHITKS